MVDIMIEQEKSDSDGRTDSDQDNAMSGGLAAIFILILIILVLLVVVAVLMVVRRRKRPNGLQSSVPLSRWYVPEPEPTMTDLDSIYSDAPAPMPSTRDRGQRPPKKLTFGFERTSKPQRIAPPYVPPLSYHEVFGPNGKSRLPDDCLEKSFDEPDFLESGGRARWM